MAEEAIKALEEKGLLTCTDVAGYGEAVAQAPAQKRLVVFTANTTGSPAASWCPDCRRSIPAVVDTALSGGLPLTVVGVGERDDWKLDARGGDHPFRAKDGLALTGVPTLLVISKDGKEAVRLGSELEDEEKDAEAVRQLITEAVEKVAE
mmetsp:Transcript_123316/g.343425  ORF Transcript_123316/g.343425 Transcript_123316/m.343425 type:complete len:150 (+) Transcript_123316:87-536(+)|eukprot:CAMPEP_0179076056 /NCGR_PEP_ID=MMETSP0796-20121207/33906_1 /TAXON_ID=73915 /ORGANISM="Pyrodinium bahamense, Strain pbaha01" /LENGTH=149 /DNA_ID=CAMNT_0020773301 /DNA_START=87 /DNA_END=536 /DNA_ORIENTATION=-